MKKILIILFVFAATAAPLSVAAAEIPSVDSSRKVVDFAGLLTDSEEFELSETARSASEMIGMDIVVLTVIDDLGKRPEAYSEEFYEFNGYGYGADYDGVILYVNMTTLGVYITGCGRAIAIYTPMVQNSILDTVTPYLSDERYYEAFSAYIDSAAHYASSTSQEEIDRGYDEITRELDLAEESQLHLTPLSAAGIAVPVAAIFMLILLLTHSRSLSPKPSIRTYMNDGLKLTRVEDQFLHTHTTRVAKPQDTGSGGKGGGGAHRSSGGRTFSGSGRKF